MGLLSALFATVLLMALGVSVVLLGTAERTLAAHDRESRALAYASRAAAAIAMADLEALSVAVDDQAFHTPPHGDGAAALEGRGQCQARVERLPAVLGGPVAAKQDRSTLHVHASAPFAGPDCRRRDGARTGSARGARPRCLWWAGLVRRGIA